MEYNHGDTFGSDISGLERFGPFRCYWCMPWEAFLQILKRMFNMTNYKSAPLSVANLWSLKAALALAHGPRSNWHEDVTVPAGPLLFGEALRNTTSVILRFILDQDNGGDVTAARLLRSVLRGPEEMKVGSWVHLAVMGSQP